MKRILSFLLASFLFVVPAAAHDWSKVASLLRSATFPIADLEGYTFCSAFLINDQEDLVLTADHCAHYKEFTVNGLVMEEEFYGHEFLDVAVLKVPGITGKELSPELGKVEVGGEVASYGYAREVGMYAHFRAGNVAAVDAVIDNRPGFWFVTDQPYIGAMSGGPVVNTDGKVVSVVQRSDRRLNGIGRSIKEIYKATKEFWRK